MMRIMLQVFVDLDQVPGSFDTPESAKDIVQSILDQRIDHYNPNVVITSGRRERIPGI